MNETDYYIFRDRAVVRTIDTPTFYGRELYVRADNDCLLLYLQSRWGGYLRGRRWITRNQRTIAAIEEALA